MKSCWIAFGVFCAVFAAALAQSGGSFRLMSSEWHDGGTVPIRNVFNESGCNGGNFSPELHWSGAPSGTKSFALTIFDPDAPGGEGWWHWVVVNIPSTTTGLVAGAGDKESSRLPTGSSQFRNDYGELGYGGPCPPHGTTHHYRVKIFALNLEKLSDGPNSSPRKVAKELEAHAIGTAQITTVFGD
jgi:Raf kinase inhibitor-like YbhB/YbcL family protein